MSRWCDHELKPAEGKMLAGMFECVHCGTWVKERPAAPHVK